MDFWKSSIIKSIEDDFRMKRVLQSKNKNINIITQEKKEESIINKLLPFLKDMMLKKKQMLQFSISKKLMINFEIGL